MRILTLKEGIMTVIADGSPEYIALYIQNKSIPKGAIVSGKENFFIPEFSSEEQKEEFLQQIKTEQKDYVVSRILSQRNGTYHGDFVYKTNLSKGNVRLTKTIVRFGCKYSHLKDVKISDVSSPGSLPWGEWDKDYGLYLINHKGETYVRCTLTKSKKHRKQEKYCDLNLNPVEIENLPQEVKESLLKEKKGHPQDVFNVNIKNIMRI